MEDKENNIFNEVDYNKHFSNELKKEALKYAYDTYKLEIDHYWKRAAYFWGFIAAIFAGYLLIFSSSNDIHKNVILVLIAFIGFLFSIGWYLVNRGSKYWFENWTKHIDFLEDDVIGPLFKTHYYHQNKILNVLSSYHFSVTKINILLSFITILIWILILIYSINNLFVGTCLYSLNYIFFLIYFILLLSVFICLLRKSLSKVNNQRKNVNKGEEPIFLKKELDDLKK